MLIALTKGASDLFSEGCRREHQLGPASSVQSAIARLKERELVDVRSGHAYRISDTFLRFWIANAVRKSDLGD